MSRQIQFRRGTSAEHENFTGAVGEITVDTTNNTVRVHDGATLGGTPLARADSVTDMAGTDYVIAWQMPADDNNYTWYRKYKSGWLEMGGRLTGKSVVFPVAFALIPTLTFGTGSTDSAATPQNTYNNLTTTGFTGWQSATNAGWHSGATNFNGYWHACGIAAE